MKKNYIVEFKQRWLVAQFSFESAHEASNFMEKAADHIVVPEEASDRAEIFMVVELEEGDEAYGE